MMPRQGTVVADRYRLERKVGGGRVSAMWRVQDQVTDASCAIKLLHRSMNDHPEALARFSLEDRLSRELTGDYFPERVGSGSWHSLRYIAWRWYEGECLRSLFERNPKQDVQTVYSIVQETCQALTLVHNAGYSHGDLKPENLFFADRAGDSSRQLKLLGFGVASRLARPLLGSQARRTPGQIVGSPLYLSPDLILGRVPRGGQADLWALSVIVYEALTGRAPFLGTDLAEVLEAILERRAARPTTITNLPATFDLWWTQAMEQQFATASDFSTSLARALAPALRSSRTQRSASLPDRISPVGQGLVWRSEGSYSEGRQSDGKSSYGRSSDGQHIESLRADASPSQTLDVTPERATAPNTATSGLTAGTTSSARHASLANGSLANGSLANGSKAAKGGSTAGKSQGAADGSPAGATLAVGVTPADSSLAPSVAASPAENVEQAGVSLQGTAVVPGLALGSRSEGAAAQSFAAPQSVAASEAGGSVAAPANTAHALVTPAADSPAALSRTAVVPGARSPATLAGSPPAAAMPGSAALTPAVAPAASLPARGPSPLAGTTAAGLGSSPIASAAPAGARFPAAGPTAAGLGGAPNARELVAAARAKADSSAPARREPPRPERATARRSQPPAEASAPAAPEPQRNSVTSTTVAGIGPAALSLMRGRESALASAAAPAASGAAAATSVEPSVEAHRAVVEASSSDAAAQPGAEAFVLPEALRNLGVGSRKTLVGIIPPAAPPPTPPVAAPLPQAAAQPAAPAAATSGQSLAIAGTPCRTIEVTGDDELVDSVLPLRRLGHATVPFPRPRAASRGARAEQYSEEEMPAEASPFAEAPPRSWRNRTSNTLRVVLTDPDHRPHLVAGLLVCSAAALVIFALGRSPVSGTGMLGQSTGSLSGRDGTSLVAGEAPGPKRSGPVAGPAGPTLKAPSATPPPAPVSTDEARTEAATPPAPALQGKELAPGLVVPPHSSSAPADSSKPVVSTPPAHAEPARVSPAPAASSGPAPAPRPAPVVPQRPAVPAAGSAAPPAAAPPRPAVPPRAPVPAPAPSTAPRAAGAVPAAPQPGGTPPRAVPPRKPGEQPPRPANPDFDFGI